MVFGPCAGLPVIPADLPVVLATLPVRLFLRELCAGKPFICFVPAHPAAVLSSGIGIEYRVTVRLLCLDVHADHSAIATIRVRAVYLDNIEFFVLLKVLEDIWMEIRRWHPEIPPAVIIIASGTDGRQTRLGHHAPGRWNVAGQQYAEIMISGEGLRRSPKEVLGTLLHEAAHALAHERGIKDTSRQGRYHNKHFKTHAEQLGLTVEHDDRFGWSAAKVTSTTEFAYARQLRDLAEAMTLWRHGETPTGPTARRNTNFIAAVCPCGRSIRVAASTLAEAPITCQACDQNFQAKNADGA